MFKWLIAACCLFPYPFSVLGLRCLGIKISMSARIGLSIVIVEELKLGKKAKIGHLNFIRCISLRLADNSKVLRSNVIHGPLKICMAENAAIGNNNKITKAYDGRSTPISILRLGIWSKITANHRIDLTRSITFGDYTTLAGIASQLWTHGYLHDSQGIGRYRVDGEIKLGDNIYIGTGAIVMSGVEVGNGVQVGAGAVVSKSLYGIDSMYVNQQLRKIDVAEIRNQRNDLELDENISEERVYLKSLNNDSK